MLDERIEEAERDTRTTDRPGDDLPAAQRLGDLLALTTEDWYRQLRGGALADPAIALGDAWLAALAALPAEFHRWAEETFLLWSHHWLPDIVESMVDGEAEQLVDDALDGLCRDMPLCLARDHRDRLLYNVDELYTINYLLTLFHTGRCECLVIRKVGCTGTSKFLDFLHSRQPGSVTSRPSSGLSFQRSNRSLSSRTRTAMPASC